MQRVDTIASQLGHRRYCHLESSADAAVIILHREFLNTLTTSMRAALLYYFRQAEEDPAVRCIVITGEGGAFSCGVDITDFKASAVQPSYEDGTIPSLATLANIIEGSKKIVVAAIHGIAFSGGLELALAAHYRVASSVSVFSFPEMQLGIVPCGGGTQRLPRLIGLCAAVEMIITSKKVKAIQALKLGLLDHIVPCDETGEMTEEKGGINISINGRLNTVVAAAIRRAACWKKPRCVSCDNSKLGNSLVNRALLSWSATQIQKNFPKEVQAPLRCLKAIHSAVTAPSFSDGLKEEMKLFLQALESPEAHAMQHLLRSSCRLMGDGTLALLPQGYGGGLMQIRRLGVVGCGTVGKGITLLALHVGLPVTVVEVTEKKCRQTLSFLHSELELDVENGYLTAEQRGRCLRMLSVVAYTGDLLSSLKDIDFVIECLADDFNLKRQVLTRLSAVCPPHCIMATSSSLLSLEELAKVTRRPEKVIGMHFFAPTDATPLLEIIQGKCTDRATVLQAVHLGRFFHKTVILNNDMGVCFTKRIFSMMMYQAYAILEHGAFPIEVDRALRRFGFHIGIFPIEDLSGLDFTERIRAELQRQPQQCSERPFFPTADVFTLPKRLLEEGRLGQKTKKGWYTYEKSGPLTPAAGRVFGAGWMGGGVVGESCAGPSLGNLREYQFRLRQTPRPDRTVDLMVLNVCQQKKILRRDISEKEMVERILFVAVNEAANLLRGGVISSSAAVDVAMVGGYGFPGWKGGLCYYADKIGLANVVRRMRIYNRAFGDTLFPPPCEELLEMVASQQTFRSKWP